MCIEGKNRHGIAAMTGRELTSEQAEAIYAAMDISGSYLECIAQAKALCRCESMTGAVSELEQLYDALGELKLNIRLDFSIPSDTQYYNGLIFCGYVKGVSRAVLSGGRYDNLMEKMGKKGKRAIGFALYFDELERFLNTQPPEPLDAVIIYDETSCMTTVADAVKLLVAEGKKVWAAEDLPEGRAYRRLIRIVNNTVKEEEGNA